MPPKNRRPSAFFAATQEAQRTAEPEQEQATVTPPHSDTVEQQQGDTVIQFQNDTVEQPYRETEERLYSNTVLQQHGETETPLESKTVTQFDKVTFYLPFEQIKLLDNVVNDYNQRLARGQARINRHDIVRHLIAHMNPEDLEAEGIKHWPRMTTGGKDKL